jgi:hypothetical protein
MAVGITGKLRYMLQRFTGGISTRLNLDEIDRYWRYPRSGDRYLQAYQHARRLSGSTDDLAKQLRFHTLMQAVEHVLTRRVEGDVAEGGIMVSDDYGSSHFPGASQAVDEYVAQHPPRIAIQGHAGGILLHY